MPVGRGHGIYERGSCVTTIQAVSDHPTAAALSKSFPRDHAAAVSDKLLRQDQIKCDMTRRARGAMLMLRKTSGLAHLHPAEASERLCATAIEEKRAINENRRPELPGSTFRLLAQRV